ncbi:MAG: phosphate ABC transporter permease PstA [Alphaproteobacteria bacterium]
MSLGDCVVAAAARKAARVSAPLAFWIAPGLVAAVFFWIVGDIFVHGAARVSWSFLTEAPRDAGRAGGIAPILVSTGLILLVCLAVALPLAVGTALLLAEFVPQRHPGARLVRLSLDTLAAVPSVVFGIFGNAFFCVMLGLGFSIVSGGLTLACMILPVLIRTSETGIRAVPQHYRRQAAALGITRNGTILRLVLPMARPGILVGALLGIGRAAAETVALVFTSGYVDRMPSSLMDSGRALSIHILDLSMNVAGGDASAYGTALVLMCVLFVINGIVICTTSLWKKRAGLGRAVIA